MFSPATTSTNAPTGHQVSSTHEDDLSNTNNEEKTHNNEKKSQNNEAPFNKEKSLLSDADNTLYHLHAIHFCFCLFMLGGYARLFPTILNSFSPNTLDQAFEEDHLNISIPLVFAVAICMTADFFYYFASRAKDRRELKEKREEYEAAKAAKEAEEIAEQTNKNKIKTLTATSSNDLLTSIIKQKATSINTNKAAIAEIIKNDIFIQQLMIQCDIHREDFLEALNKNGDNVDIPSLLQQFSKNISLNDYNNDHETHKIWSRRIESLQSVKIAFRFISVLLLLNGRAWEYPDIGDQVGFGSLADEEHVFGWILVGGIFLLALNAYVYYLDFKKNNTKMEYNKEIRELRSTHHNVCLSTLILALDRKVTTSPQPITLANPALAPTTVQLIDGLNFSLATAHWLKPFISLVGLGALCRRLATIWGLSSESAPEGTDLLLVIGGTVVLMLVDVTYITLTTVEERWDIKNIEDRTRVLSACKDVETRTSMSDADTSTLSDEGKTLCQSYRHLNEASATIYKKKPLEGMEKFLSDYKAFIDQTLFIKFSLRAIGVAWGFTQIGAGENFENQQIGVLSAPDAIMLFAGITGCLLGILAQQMNKKREQVKNMGHDNDAYTQNALFFFKDPVVTNSPTNSPKLKHSP